MRTHSTIHSQHNEDRRKRLRAATSLIEAVAIMMIIGGLLSISGVAIHRTAQLQKLSLSFIRQEKLLDDFQQQLRNDIQAASDFSIQGDVVKITLTQQTLEYSLDESQSIQRSVKNTAGEIVGMNRWRVGAQSVKFERNAKQAIPLLHCHLRLSYAPPSAENKAIAAEPASEQTAGSVSVPKPDNSDEVREVHWLFRAGVHQR